MNRIDRLYAIMIYIQGRKRTSMDQLVAKFGLSRRTLFRDIKALIEDGLPLAGDAGSGYFIVEGYHLPPVSFNKEEAASLIMGSKLIETYAQGESSLNFQNALNKIRSVVRENDKEFLEELDKRISVYQPGDRNTLDKNIIEIQYAIASNRTMDLEYRSGMDGTLTKREVEPLGLVFYSSHWHLIAYCRLRKGLRDFRTDRITQLSITTNEFLSYSHPDFMDFITEASYGSDAVKIILEVNSSFARFISETKYFYGLVDEKMQGENILMTFYNSNLYFFTRWLLPMGNNVRIKEPVTLKNMIISQSRELLNHHS
jgi:predicted DNA-binding transcriptional regulator YafY